MFAYTPYLTNVLKFFFPDIIWDIKVKQKKIYLTFDDGPNKESTPFILELLDKYNAKASFFCLGKNVENNLTLYEEILKARHIVANHTYSHLNGWKTNTLDYINDIKRAKELINSNLFRPPYGKITFKQKKEICKDFKIVMWRGISGDFSKNISYTQCVNNAKKALFPGSIIVFHDNIKTKNKLHKSLPLFLNECQKKGFTFESLHNLYSHINHNV